jgi:hypothetical protein
MIEERTRSVCQSDLATYVSLEYGRGTDPSFLIAQAINAARAGRRKRRYPDLRKAFAAVAGVLTAPFRNDGDAAKVRVDRVPK